VFLDLFSQLFNMLLWPDPRTFGWIRFKDFITSHASLSAGYFADELIQHISSWSGKHLDAALDDDLTLVVADFKNS